MSNLNLIIVGVLNVKCGKFLTVRFLCVFYFNHLKQVSSKIKIRNEMSL